MIPLEKQVKQVLDDEALNAAEYAAKIEALIEQHGRAAVVQAIAHWRTAMNVWLRALQESR
jgi:hypothetical protein